MATGRLDELIAKANVIEFRDGKLFRLVSFRERKVYEILYDESGQVRQIIEKSM